MLDSTSSTSLGSWYSSVRARLGEKSEKSAFRAAVRISNLTDEATFVQRRRLRTPGRSSDTAVRLLTTAAEGRYDEKTSKQGRRTVVARERDSGDLCCIELYSDYNYVWDVSFVHAEKKYGDPHKKERSPYSFDDLNEAISDAYKLWKAGCKIETSVPTGRPFRAGIVAFD
jgi:hypothetical protein